MRRSTLFTLIPFLMLGCSGGIEKFPIAKVSGKVLCEGQPVSDVRIYFAPIGDKAGDKVEVTSGKSGMGTADEDGNFTISTYGEGDGAVVGQHNVVVSGPHPEEFPNFSCKCETDPNRPVQQVEVISGEGNEFTINLHPKTATSKANIDAEDLADIKAGDEQEKADKAKAK